MLRFNETQIELTAGMKRKISNYANFGGGIYRMNTIGASYYSFTPFKDEKGKINFCGGFDWFSSLPNRFAYVYDIQKGRFYTMTEFAEKFKSEIPA